MTDFLCAQNTSNADFFLQKMKPDPEGDSDYLQQVILLSKSHLLLSVNGYCVRVLSIC